jgi:hypothetical protein
MDGNRRAMLEGQSLGARHEQLHQAKELWRSSVLLLEALNRRPGQWPARLSVGRLDVHTGG